MTSSSNPTLSHHLPSLYLDQLVQKKYCKETGSLTPLFPETHLPYLEGEEHAPFYKLASELNPIIQGAVHHTYFAVTDVQYIGGSLFKDLPKSYYDRCDKVLGVEPLPSPFHTLIKKPKNDVDVRVWMNSTIEMSDKDCAGQLSNLRLKVATILGSRCTKSYEIFFDGNLFVLFKIEDGEHPLDLAFIIKLKRSSLFVLDDFNLSLLPYFYTTKPAGLAPGGSKKNGWQAYIDRRTMILRISKVEDVNQKGWLAYLSFISSGTIPKKDYSAVLIKNLKKMPPFTTEFPSFSSLLLKEIQMRSASHDKTPFEARHLALQTVLMTRDSVTLAGVSSILRPFLTYPGASTSTPPFIAESIKLLHDKQISPNQFVALLTFAALINLSFSTQKQLQNVSEISLCPFKRPGGLPHFKMEVSEGESSRAFYFPFIPELAFKALDEETILMAESILHHLFVDGYNELTPLGKDIGLTLTKEHRKFLFETSEKFLKSGNPLLRALGMTILRMIAHKTNDRQVLDLLFNACENDPQLSFHFDEDLVRALKQNKFEMFLETNPPFSELIKELKKRYWELDTAVLFDVIARAAPATKKSLKTLRKLTDSEEQLSRRYQEHFISTTQELLHSKNISEAQSAVLSPKTTPRIMTQNQLWDHQTSAISLNPQTVSGKKINQWLLTGISIPKQENRIVEILLVYLSSVKTPHPELLQTIAILSPNLFAYIKNQNNNVMCLRFWGALQQHGLGNSIHSSTLIPLFQELLKDKNPKDFIPLLNELALSLPPEINIQLYINFLIRHKRIDLAHIWLARELQAQGALTPASIKGLINLMVKCQWDEEEKSLAIQDLLDRFLQNNAPKNTHELVPFISQIYKTTLCTKSISLSLHILSNASPKKWGMETKNYLVNLLTISGPEQTIQVLKLLQQAFPEVDAFKLTPEAVLASLRLWIERQPEEVIAYLKISENPPTPLFQHLMNNKPGMIKKLIKMSSPPVKFQLIEALIQKSPQTAKLKWLTDLIETQNYSLAMELIDCFPVENTIRERRALIPFLSANDAITETFKIVVCLGAKTPEDTQLFTQTMLHNPPTAFSEETLRMYYHLIIILEPPHEELWKILFEGFNKKFSTPEIQVAWDGFQKLFPAEPGLTNHISAFFPLLVQFVDREYLSPEEALFELQRYTKPTTLTPKSQQVLEKIICQMDKSKPVPQQLFAYLAAMEGDLILRMPLPLLKSLLTFRNVKIDFLCLHIVDKFMSKNSSPKITSQILQILQETIQLLPPMMIKKIYAYSHVPKAARIDLLRKQCRELRSQKSGSLDQGPLLGALETCVDSMVSLGQCHDRKLTEGMLSELLYILQMENEFVYDSKRIIAVIEKIKGSQNFNPLSLQKFIQQLLEYLWQRPTGDLSDGLKTAVQLLELLVKIKKAVKEQETLNLIIQLSSVHTYNITTNETFQKFCSDLLGLLIYHRKIDVKCFDFFKILLTIRDFKKIWQYFPKLTSKELDEFESHLIALPLNKIDVWYDLMKGFQGKALHAHPEIVLKLYRSRVERLLAESDELDVIMPNLALMGETIKDLSRDYMSQQVIDIYFQGLIGACDKVELQVIARKPNAINHLGLVLETSVASLLICHHSVDLLLCESILFTTTKELLFKVRSFLSNNENIKPEKLVSFKDKFIELIFFTPSRPLSIDQQLQFIENQILFSSIEEFDRTEQGPCSSSST